MEYKKTIWRFMNIQATPHDIYRKYFSLFMIGILFLLAIASSIPFISISFFVIKNGWQSLNWDFFTKIPLPPGESGGGMGNGLLGSAVIVGLSCLIGIPWGISVGILMSEYSYKKISRILHFIINLLTSVPSIVIGIFIYYLVVIRYGFSAYAGALALSLIMLPIVAKSTEEILKLVPGHIREAGLALGFPRWKVITKIIIPATLSMIITGVVLAIARIAGETAPLLFTSLGNQFYANNLSEPTSTLPVQIYEFAKSGFEDLEQLAWGGALVLIAFVFFTNLSIRFFIFLYQKRFE